LTVYVREYQVENLIGREETTYSRAVRWFVGCMEPATPIGEMQGSRGRWRLSSSRLSRIKWKRLPVVGMNECDYERWKKSNNFWRDAAAAARLSRPTETVQKFAKVNKKARKANIWRELVAPRGARFIAKVASSRLAVDKH